jgi:hypothetical protein
MCQPDALGACSSGVHRKQKVFGMAVAFGATMHMCGASHLLHPPPPDAPAACEACGRQNCLVNPGSCYVTWLWQPVWIPVPLVDAAAGGLQCCHRIPVCVVCRKLWVCLILSVRLRTTWVCKPQSRHQAP